MASTFTDPILHIEVERENLLELVCNKHVFQFNIQSLYDWILVGGLVNPITNIQFENKNIRAVLNELHKRNLFLWNYNNVSQMLKKQKKMFSNSNFKEVLESSIKYFKLGDLIKKTQEKLELEIAEHFKKINSKNFSKEQQKFFKLNEDYEYICILEKILKEFPTSGTPFIKDFIQSKTSDKPNVKVVFNYIEKMV